MNLLGKACSRISLFPNHKREKQIQLNILKSLLFHFPIFLPLKGEYIPGEIGPWYISPPLFRGREIISFFHAEVSR
jgi:hypothetical protein